MLDLKDKNIGFAMCGSFCTFKKAVAVLEELCKTGANVIPIMSDISYTTDTRFGKADDFKNKIRNLCNNDIIHTVDGAEPIGPKALLDLLVIMPCTGNTLAKLNSGIADTSVTMAAKAHLRNARPVIIAVSTNDALANAAKNIGSLMNARNIYFLPLRQDDCIKKPTSVVADFDKLIPAIEAALSKRQFQPILEM